MKKLILVLALLFSAPAWAQNQGRMELLLNALYDLDATDPTYCVYNGIGDVPTGGDKPVSLPVTTSGSSTTVSALNASTQDPFANVGVGDLIVFPQTYSATTLATTRGRNERIVTAKASADSITINAAIELPLTGTNYLYKTRSCGTAATDGWIQVRSYKDMTFTFALNQLSVASGGVAVTVECRNDSVATAANTIFAPTAYTTTGTRSFIIVEPWDQCRIGYELSGADDGSDTGADAEQITVQLRARTEN